MNGATCADAVNGFTCDCVAGYSGTLCATDNNECASSPCMNGATCVEAVDGFTCDCVAGYSGTLCATDNNECASSPCMNGATCADAVNGFTCDCVVGWHGTVCDVDTDDCASSPCQNGATCIDITTGYSCGCVAGFTGVHCVADVDECTSMPCQNAGTCSNLAGSYSCTCADGWTGAMCDADIDECASLPCMNGASCLNNANAFACSCALGYSGALCATDDDECASMPCQNAGTCSNLAGSFSCTCVAGKTGTVCDTDVDECASSPCQNGGTCTNGNNVFSCTCVIGYADATCSTNVDDCLSSPCANGGTCIDAVASHSCVCPFGFVGPSCQLAGFLVGGSTVTSFTFGDLLLVFDGGVVPANTHVAVTTTTTPNVALPNTFIQLGVVYTIGLSTLGLSPTPVQPASGRVIRAYIDVGVNAGLPVIMRRAPANPWVELPLATAAKGRRRVTETCSSTTACGAVGGSGEVSAAVANGCASSPCASASTCVASASTGIPSCVCAQGFTGVTCAINIDDCSSAPCQNGGTCVDGAAAYSCTCSAAFTGAECETDVLVVGGSSASGSGSIVIAIAVVAVLVILAVILLLVVKRRKKERRRKRIGGIESQLMSEGILSRDNSLGRDDSLVHSNLHFHSLKKSAAENAKMALARQQSEIIDSNAIELQTLSMVENRAFQTPLSEVFPPRADESVENPGYASMAEMRERPLPPAPQVSSKGEQEDPFYVSALAIKLKSENYVPFADPKAGEMPRPEGEIAPGRLVLGDALGSGVFGVVREGVLLRAHNEMPMLVAVKLLHRPTAERRAHMRPEDEEAEVYAFNNEMALLGKLHHKNITCLVGKVSLVASPYEQRLVLERADMSLQTYLKSDVRVPYADQLSMVIQVAQALIYMHTEGYVHRDVAARNCLIFRDEYRQGRLVKLTDFGMAREVEREDAVYSQRHYGRLPPAHAPEMGMPFAQSTPRSDAYMFGWFLWEVVDRCTEQMNMPFGDRPAPSRFPAKGCKMEMRDLITDLLQQESLRRSELPAVCASLNRLWMVEQEKRDFGDYSELGEHEAGDSARKDGVAPVSGRLSAMALANRSIGVKVVPIATSGPRGGSEYDSLDDARRLTFEGEGSSTHYATIGSISMASDPGDLVIEQSRDAGPPALLTLAETDQTVVKQLADENDTLLPLRVPAPVPAEAAVAINHAAPEYAMVSLPSSKSTPSAPASTSGAPSYEAFARVPVPAAKPTTGMDLPKRTDDETNL